MENLTDVSRQLSPGFPDTCPVCKCKIAALYYWGRFNERIGHFWAYEVLFRCASDDCQRLFFSYYLDNYWHRVYTFSKSLVVQSHEATEYDELIQECSPNFASIFREAEIADQNGLHEIAGAWYRRSLEFLVKDYLIKKNPEEAERIKTLKLWGKDLLGMLGDHTVTDVFKRAVWLWNDETHYERTWEDLDKEFNALKVLKGLIDLVVHDISRDLKGRQVVAMMPAKVKKTGE